MLWGFLVTLERHIVQRPLDPVEYEIRGIFLLYFDDIYIYIFTYMYMRWYVVFDDLGLGINQCLCNV